MPYVVIVSLFLSVCLSVTNVQCDIYQPKWMPCPTTERNEAVPPSSRHGQLNLK